MYKKNVMLYSVLLVLLIPPVLLFFCKTAWELARLMRILSNNAYVDKIVKENNALWRENIRLTNEALELKDKVGWKE